MVSRRVEGWCTRFGAQVHPEVDQKLEEVLGVTLSAAVRDKRARPPRVVFVEVAYEEDCERGGICWALQG